MMLRSVVQRRSARPVVSVAQRSTQAHAESRLTQRAGERTAISPRLQYTTRIASITAAMRPMSRNCVDLSSLAGFLTTRLTA
jgi:hypothetical protein